MTCVSNDVRPNFVSSAVTSCTQKLRKLADTVKNAVVWLFKTLFCCFFRSDTITTGNKEPNHKKIGNITGVTVPTGISEIADANLGKPKTAPDADPKPAPVGGPNPAPAGDPNPAPVGGPNPAPAGDPNLAPVGGPNPAPAGDPDPAPVGGPNPAPAGDPEPDPIGESEEDVSAPPTPELKPAGVGDAPEGDGTAKDTETDWTPAKNRKKSARAANPNNNKLKAKNHKPAGHG